jgi:hypothetical protein
MRLAGSGDDDGMVMWVDMGVVIHGLYGRVVLLYR